MTPGELRRFEAKVSPEPNSGCWLWTGCLTTGGYGMLQLDGGRIPKYAHRLAYEHHVGLIPEGLQIDHLCRVRSCVNPSHLEPVTQRENGLRGESMAAQQARQTHCIHGHEFTQENTYLRKDRHALGHREPFHHLFGDRLE